MSRVSDFCQQHCSLAQTEQHISKTVEAWNRSNNYNKDLGAIATHITSLLDNFKSTYDLDVRQKSVTILLIMELWMLMDRSIVDQYPLLAEFGSGFAPES